MPVTEQDVMSALKSCYDPEIPVNIVDLGLIYSVNFAPAPDALEFLRKFRGQDSEANTGREHSGGILLFHEKQCCSPNRPQDHSFLPAIHTFSRDKGAESDFTAARLTIFKPARVRTV